MNFLLKIFADRPPNTAANLQRR